MSDLWERRLRRAEQIRNEWPFAADVLRLFAALTALQREVHEEVARWAAAAPADLNPGRLVTFIPRLLATVAGAGPPPLAEAARALEAQPVAWAERLRDRWERGEQLDAGEETLWLFEEVLLQPLAMVAGRVEQVQLGRCPRCGGSPLVAVLREDPEASAAVRWLMCGRCAAEWRYPRVMCPSCQEERPEQLPRFQAEELPWVRVEACETCRRYLKLVDQTREPAAEPVTDEIAALPLDVYAVEQGYGKLTRNLAGL